MLHVLETPADDVFRTSLDGSRSEAVVADSIDKIPTGISPDGRTLAYLYIGKQNEVHLRTGDSTRRLPNVGEAAAAVVSPDGQWIACHEESAGRRLEVYVQCLSGGGRRQVSADGGDQPRWSRNGRELVFRGGDAVLAAAFDPVSEESGAEQELFRRRQIGSLNATLYLVVAAG